MNDAAAARTVSNDREELFCKFCGGLIPDCAELIVDHHGEPNTNGWVMCMATGNDFTIQEWADDDDG